jgi:multicomponent Na+:H+ antiporter subunit D
MNQLVPLPVAIPLFAAAVLTAFSHFLPRRLPDVTGLAATTATAVITGLILVDSNGSSLVYWFGGWKPRDGIALGISFSVDPLGAGLAFLAAILVLAALLFSWHYFDETGHLFHVLMLVFLAAMCGFALSGDLFNMFVFFELMGVAAYALTAYRIEELGPLQGALNFAITNSIGAFLVLLGIALVYGHTGALNLAQVGATVGHQRGHAVVIVAFLLLAIGFLVKGSIVPFHFWLADAHAVAPAPVCVLFSGAMVELGLYAVARIYWTVFAGAVSRDEHALRAILIIAGAATALVGGLMAFLQRHLKRLLAYSTVSNAGIFLIGIALLTDKGLAGSAVAVVAHGLTKGSLFLAAGVLLYLRGSIDELRLHGTGRDLPLVAGIFLLGAISLSGLPPLGLYLGHSLVDDSASAVGYQWIGPLILIAGILSNGAIFRATVRIFAGWGARRDRLLSPEPDEGEREPQQGPSPVMMLIPAVALALAGAGLSIAPGLEPLSDHFAQRFRDQAGYVATVLHHGPTNGPISSLALPAFTMSGVLYGIGTTVGAAVLGLLALNRAQLPRALRQGTRGVFGASVEALRAAHSGHIGDYIAWLTAGLAVFGVAFSVALR